MSGAWKPQEYAAHSGGQALWAKELIEKIGLHGNETILDIGCGDGKITDLLATHTQGEVVGIDASKEMITYANAMFATPVFRKMDARNLDFDNRFDVVFSNAALHWVDDHAAVVRGIYNALKTEGRTILQMGGFGNAQAVFDAVGKIIPEYASFFDGYTAPYRFCSDDEYSRLLENAGFRRFRCELIPKTMIHENIGAFRGWLETTWFPYINRVPEAEQDAFVSAWIDAYLAVCPADAKGRIYVEMMRLEVAAEK